MKIELSNPSLPVQHYSKSEKVANWIHEHPTLVKVLKVAALVIGIAILTALPFTAPILGSVIVVTAAITGSFLTLASLVAFLALDLFAPPHHDMKNHTFKPGQCEGGRLFYQGDVPILTLESDDPYKAGKAQGYLCGDAINRLSNRFGMLLRLSKQSDPNLLPNTLAEFRRVIPEKYLLEMRGLVDGYNKWSKEHCWQFPKKLTVDDVILLHLIPDLVHFQAARYEKNGIKRNSAEEQQAIACTAIVDQDGENNEITFARNMDWPSFGVAGAYTLIINRKYGNGQNTVEVGLPGIIGTITGMNSQGLCVAMNVCQGYTQEIRGMPACLYNRACLEECDSVSDVEQFIYKQSPLGSYHLTVADQKGGESIHFYQSHQDTHVIRRRNKDLPLVTLNDRYFTSAIINNRNSKENRQIWIDHFFQNRVNKPLEEALALPFVNNSCTTHKVVMQPKTRKFKVAFDNAFAGKIPLHSVSTENLL